MRSFIFAFAFLFLSSGFAQTIPPKDALSKEEARQFAELVQMPGLEQLISDQAKTILESEIDRKIEEWLKEEKVPGTFLQNSEVMRNGSTSQVSPQKSSPIQKGTRYLLQEKIKARLIKWLPTQLEKIVKKELLKGETGRAIYAELNKTLNEQADRWLGGWYDRLAGKTKVDSLVAERLGDLLGKSTVRGLQKGILVGLRGEMPKEALQYLRMGPDKFAEYVAKGKVYLPGAQFRKHRQQLMQLHIFDLPNRVYGGILAASAAMHMAKAFSGWKINPRELKRAQEVIRTMIWQLKTKKAVSMTLGDFTQLVKRLGDQLGSFHWRAFQQMAKWNPAKLFLDKLDQIEKEFGKLDQLYDKTSGKVLAGMNEGISELEKKLKELSQGLLQPMTNPISCFGGMNGIAASGILAKDCPDIFSELPDVTSWKGLKKAIGREDGLFGKWGDQIPWTKAKEFYQKSVVNQKMAEGMAKAAVKITDALHITGPLAEILKVEKVPARHVSKDSDFDPVLLHNGEFYYTATDLFLPGAADFQFTRIYRSRSEFLGVLGHHWTHNLAQRLLPWQSPDPSPRGGFGLTYVDGEGKKWFLQEVEVGVFQPPADLAIQFQTTSEGYSLTRDELIYQFNPEGILTAIQDSKSQQLTLSYNDAGQLTEVTEPSGQKIEFRYLANGLLEKLIDPTGRAWSYEYNEDQELIAVTVPGTARFPKGKTTHYAYDNRQMTLIMDPKGQVYLQNYYGKAGKDAGKILAQKYGDGKYITEARYDGLDTWVVDRRGVLHQYKHDEEGELVEKVPGTFLQNNAGMRDVSTKQVSSQQSSLIQKGTRYLFDSWGNIVAIHSPNGGERRFEVDANNLITKEIVDGEERFYQYDANDNIIAIEVPSRQLKLELEYDILDRLITQKEILHEAKVITTRYEYDPQGRLARLIYPLGNAIRFVYDEAGELHQMIRGEGTLDKSVQTFSREAVETPSLAWPPAFPPPQQEADVVYDPLGRPIQIEGITMVWDDNSRLSALTSEQGETTHYYYDSLNRLVLEKFPDGSERSYAYDSADRLTGTIQRDGTPIVYEYNEQGKLAKRESPTLRQEFYYDREGRLIRAVDFNDLAIRADDIEVAFAYDKNSRLVGEKIHGQWVYKSFDQDNQKIGITYPNGLQVVREYQNKKLVHLFAEGQPIPIPCRKVPGTFLQNDKNLCNPPYNSDTTAEEIVPSKKEPGTFRRDTNGNLVEDDDFAYAYDSLHRLVAVQEKQTNKKIRFQYDPLGRLAGKGKTRYFYDEWNSIAAYSEDRTQRHTIYGSEMDRPAAFFNGDDLYFYRLDRFGSVRQVIDPSGRIVEEHDYLPFGEMAIQKASSIGNELGFIGRPFDFEGRLVYLRHRFYAPQHHQFLTADPLGYKNEFYATPQVQTPINFSYHQGQGGAPRTSFPNYVEEEGEKILIDFDLFTIAPPAPVNIPETDLYAYAGGDPLHYYDPLGLYKVEVDLPPWDADPSKNQRGKAGRLMLRDDQGWPVAGPYPVLGRSSDTWFSKEEGGWVKNGNKNRDPSKLYGDTPVGEYRVTRFTKTNSFGRFGPYKIAIDPIGGQALQAKLNGRENLLIHGGRNGLTSTRGCVRMKNQDILRLVEAVNRLRRQGDDIGTTIIKESL